MGFSYDFGGEEGLQEATLNVERQNKWTDAVIPLSGNTIYLSGSSPQIAQLTQFNHLHVLISKNACHIVSSTDPTLSASTSYQYWPADLPAFHIPQSGSTEYVSIRNNDGTVVEAWISVAERLDNQ